MHRAPDNRWAKIECFLSIFLNNGRGTLLKFVNSSIIDVRLGAQGVGVVVFTTII